MDILERVRVTRSVYNPASRNPAARFPDGMLGQKRSYILHH